MTASRTRDLAALDAYVSGELEGDEAEALEEAMFEAIGREAAPAEAFYLALRDQVRALAERGTLHPVLRPEDAARLRDSSPLRVGVVEVGAPVDVEAVLAGDIVLVRVPLALEGVTRVDVETSVGSDPPTTYPDVPFDPGAGCIWMCCEIELAKQSVAAGAVQRFVAVRGEERRVLRELRLDSI